MTCPIDWQAHLTSMTLGDGFGPLIPRAGDRIRTGDVQLGKLAFYR